MGVPGGKGAIFIFSLIWEIGPSNINLQYFHTPHPLFTHTSSPAPAVQSKYVLGKPVQKWSSLLSRTQCFRKSGACTKLVGAADSGLSLCWRVERMEKRSSLRQSDPLSLSTSLSSSTLLCPSLLARKRGNLPRI